ncbi:MAG: DUF2232 domain-containing protein [bacterium]
MVLDNTQKQVFSGDAGQKEAAKLWLSLVGIAIIPLGAFFLHPSLGTALGVMTPIPLAYGMKRRNITEGFGAIALVAMATAFVQGPAAGLLFAVETFPLVLAIYWAIGAEAPPYLSVLAGVGFVAGVALVTMFIYSFTTDLTLGEVYRQTLEKMGFFMETVSAGNDVPAENVQQLQWVIDIWKRLFAGIWLSTLTLLLAFYTVLTRGLLVQTGFMEEEEPSFFARWYLPFPFVGVFIVLSAIVVLGSGTVKNVALNGLIPLGTLYGIQGMVVLGHIFSRWGIPHMFRILILMFVAIAYPMVLIIAVALMGLFDTWIDFRSRFPFPEEGE